MEEQSDLSLLTGLPIAPAFTRLDAMEARICVRWNRLGRRPRVRGWFSVVSRLGDGIAWYATLLVLPLVRGPVALAASAHMALTGMLGVVIYKSLKRVLGRPRPCASCRAVRALVPPLDAGSFPSGHTLHAVAFTIMLGYYEPALLVLAVPFAVSVALSRVLLGLHYPSDVAAGGVIGAVLALSSLGLAAVAAGALA